MFNLSCSLAISLRHVILTLAASIAVLSIAACGGHGGGGSSPPPPVVVTNHTVTLSWTANHEKGVNSTGGGYHVAISGKPTIDVLSSGSTAPTSTVTTLQTGTYTVTVTAFAALDAQGGLTGSVSAPSQSLIVNVP